MASIPFKMILYVRIGSAPVNGGVPINKQHSLIRNDFLIVFIVVKCSIVSPNENYL